MKATQLATRIAEIRSTQNGEQRIAWAILLLTEVMNDQVLASQQENDKRDFERLQKKKP